MRKKTAVRPEERIQKFVMTHCFTYSSKVRIFWHELCFLSIWLEPKCLCGDSCVWASSLWGQEVELVIVVSPNAFIPRVCWHASLNQCSHHPSRKVSFYRIRPWQTPLLFLRRGSAAPVVTPGVCDVWLLEVKGCVCRSSGGQCPLLQLWHCRLRPMEAGSDATPRPESHPPAFKKLGVARCANRDITSLWTVLPTAKSGRRSSL